SFRLRRRDDVQAAGLCRKMRTSARSNPGARQPIEIVSDLAQAAFLAALARSFLHLARNTLRSLPCRFLASACFEHSIESAVRGLAGAFGVVCAIATPKVKANAMALARKVVVLISRSIGYPVAAIVILAPTETTTCVNRC